MDTMELKKGTVIIQKQADKYLSTDIKKFESQVNKYNYIYKFTQNQFDALVCFAFNIGSIDGLTQNGTRTIEQISNSFHKYRFSSGKLLNGLVKRRAKEKALFNKQ